MEIAKPVSRNSSSPAKRMPLFEPDSSEDEEPPVAPEPDQSELETAVPLASEGNNDDRTAPRDTPNVPQNPTTLDDTESVKDMPAPILNETTEYADLDGDLDDSGNARDDGRPVKRHRAARQSEHSATVAFLKQHAKTEG